jgi:hypothetical protein
MTLLILSLLCGAVFAAEPSANVDISRILDTKMPLFIMSNEDEFLRLCGDLRIPCGEERLPNQQLVQTADYGFRQEEKTVRTLLNKMLLRRPGFLWEVSDGVLVLRPRSTRVTSPLDRRIHRFTQEGRIISEIVRELAARKRIGTPAPRMAAGPDYGQGESESKKIDIACVNLTARQILNTAVRTHGHTIWVYTYEPLSSGIIHAFFHRGELETISF